MTAAQLKASTDASSELQQQISTSQISLATVVALFFCIGVMIADRCVMRALVRVREMMAEGVIQPNFNQIIS